MIDPIVMQELRLIGIEDGGIWVESQALSNLWLAKLGLPASPRTLVWFLPYHEIKIVMHSIEQTSLSESAFGVQG